MGIIGTIIIGLIVGLIARFLKPGDDGALLFGKNIGLDIGNTKLPGDRVGGGAVVAGQHDDPDAVARQRFQGRSR